jgi:excisionase family DNA binding protein
MHHRSQFGMRENPVSDRRHRSHPAVSNVANEHCDREPAVATSPVLMVHDQSKVGVHTTPNPALSRAATGEESRDDTRLMTVHEVAELLQVPSSWVYAHTRHRCLNRIPGIRLGKYWRFERAEILRWIDANRKKDYRHAG